MKTHFLVLLFAVLIATSCGDSGYTLPTVTGTKYEVLVVMDEPQWKAPSGRSLVALLDRDMEGLPQPEPITNIMRCDRKDFSDMLKPSRNVLLTEISDKYTQPRIIYSTNKWAKPQSVVRVLAPNDSVFAATIATYGENILNFFVKNRA